VTQWDSSWPELASEDERHHLFGYLKERFGIPEDIFKEYLLFRRKKSWQLIKNVNQVVYASILKVSKVGVRAFQKVGAYVRPTTRMIQVFGHRATKARLEIDEEQLSMLLKGEQLSVDLAVDRGYVILTLKDNRILGLGFFVNGRVRSQISRKELRQAMLIY
jgi:NOL1/NOP2/fmu family ribosome biogenesis protein